MEKENMQMKQNSKKRFWVLVAAVMIIGVAVVVTGCKSGGGGGSSSTATPPSGGNNIVLPPDPGEEGRATIAGIDSDGDGVRDDVQRYIALTYPDSEMVRAALTQHAITMQEALLDYDVKELSVQHGIKSDIDGACLWYVLGSVEARRNARNDIKEVLFNTDERNYAYFAYNDHLGGEVFRSVPYDERASACEFDVASLPN